MANFNTIDDINDQSVSILYGARNKKDFKEKLKIYEKIRTKSAATSKSLNSPTVEKIMKLKEEVRCFNCDELSHKSRTCKNKNKSNK